jgi:DNA-binding Lrp family transcriptional regulator
MEALRRQILEIVERDGRADPGQIGRMLGVPRETVEEVLRQAEESGLVVGYKAVVHWEKAGEDLILALIEVKVSPQRDVGFDALAQRIARFPETRSVYLVSGAYDLAVQVVGRSMREIANFVAEKLAPLPGVQGTVTHFMLKRYKEDGFLFLEHDEATRLPITP